MATPDPNKKLGLDELASQYGYAAAFFNSDGELRSIIDQAVREQWTADNFKAKFMASNWYRTRGDSLKQWSELESRNPAEASSRVNQKLADLQARAAQLGITVDPGRLNQIARDSLVFGWTDQMLSNALAAEWKYQPNGGTQGSAATTEQKIRSSAGEYGVSVSDGQVVDLVSGVLAGRYSDDHIQDLVRDMARSKYPGMRGYLDQGFTVRQIASPYAQSYAQILEKDAGSVDLNDPLMQQALQGTPDPKTGQAAMQSVYQFEQSLRKDPRWLTTKNANDQMKSVGQRVLQDFGLYS